MTICICHWIPFNTIYVGYLEMKGLPESANYSLTSKTKPGIILRIPRIPCNTYIKKETPKHVSKCSIKAFFPFVEIHGKSLIVLHLIKTNTNHTWKYLQVQQKTIVTLKKTIRNGRFIVCTWNTNNQTILISRIMVLNSNLSISCLKLK